MITPLHMPTLSIVTAAVIAFSGLLLLIARGHDRNACALAFWGAAMIVGAAGLACLSFGPAIGATAGLTGTTLVLFGTGLSWTGARVFIGRAPRPWLVAAGPAVWLLGGLLSPGLAGWGQLEVGFCAGAAYTIAAAGELWRGRHEPLPSRDGAIALLLLHAVIWLARGLSLPFDGLASEASSAPVFAILMFEALLHTIGMAFLLLACMKERAELRSTIQLRQLAMLDGLTGLGNRRQFDQAMERETQRAARDRTALALLMIDADHFKSYNDTYGHAAGDDCLRTIASAVRSAAHRPGDIAVRYGGEEFAVILCRTDEAGAAKVADAIHSTLAGLRLPHAGTPHGDVSVSIGVAALVPAHGTIRPDRLLRAADAALYAAKAAGRNRTHRAGQTPGPAPDTLPGVAMPASAVSRAGFQVTAGL